MFVKEIGGNSMPESEKGPKQLNA